MKLQVGQEAPAFTALDQNGEQHSLSDYRGQYLLLYFYPKDDTPGCTTEACSFRDGYSELKKEVAILGVSADSVESHAVFAQKYALPFPLLSDTAKNMQKAYGTTGLLFASRSSFLIDPQGKIVKIYEDVIPEEHVNEIKQDIAALP